MITRSTFQRAAWPVLASLILLLSACASPTPQVVEVTRLVPQTVVVTQIITVEPAAPAVTDTPQPGPTPAPTQPPVQAPTATYAVYSPIKDCAASRLHFGDIAYVSFGGGANAIRSEPDIHSADNITGYAKEGDELSVIGGPECSWGWIMWMVRTKDGVEGWTPESDGQNFWLVP